MIDTIVDINHDNAIDFKKAKTAGIVAIIHKASEGATFRDPEYSFRKAKALAAGFLWRAYHFASSRPVKEQVENFLKAEPLKSAADGKVVMCLDFEESSSGPDMTLAQAEEFVTLLRKKIGRAPMIYGAGMLRDAIGKTNNKVLGACRLWYARYRSRPLGLPTSTWPKFTLWQYTDGANGDAPHSVPGMGPTDRNRFDGTTEELQKQWPFA